MGIGAVVGVAGCSDSADDSGDGENEPDSFKWASASVFEDLQLTRTEVPTIETGAASE
jgi:hypothetical protein